MRFDFPTVMVTLVLVSGVIWLLDMLFLAKRRRDADGRITRPPSVIVDYAKSFFPVFLVVLVLRSFVAEPFRIPSNSMMPTLLTGDFILVNKYVYGIRLPVIDRKIIEIDLPQRGDVMVFRYPKDPSTPFIKRVIGIPGDKIAYYNKTLYINGEEVPEEELEVYTGFGSGIEMTGASRLKEFLPGRPHDILLQRGLSGAKREWVVPTDNYFVLGDNRDNSRDSRFWGTVPDELLIGKAFMIWMNWDLGHGIDWGRIGNAIE